MINLCATEFNAIGLTLNIKKSVCMRVGPHFNLIKHPVSNISIGNEVLKWKSEIRFLGVSFLSAAVFKCNFQIVSKNISDHLMESLEKLVPVLRPRSLFL